jgi:dTDP-4-amino-4,6-dideoxygalactose transaminase
MPSRDELVELLAAEGIPAVAGYTRLLYENPLFTRRGVGYGRGTCPRAEQINREFLWFTFINPPNGPRDMDDAADALEKIFAHASDRL